MPKLKIDTKKSLYRPIEVEIDGKTFLVKRLTRDTLRVAEELDAEVKTGNLDAVYKRLEFLLGKSKIFDKLDLNQVAEITKFIISSMLSPEKEEKNASGPEGEKLPS